MSSAGNEHIPVYCTNQVWDKLLSARTILEGPLRAESALPGNAVVYKQQQAQLARYMANCKSTRTYTAWAVYLYQQTVSRFVPTVTSLQDFSRGVTAVVQSIEIGKMVGVHNIAASHLNAWSPASKISVLPRLALYCKLSLAQDLPSSRHSVLSCSTELTLCYRWSALPSLLY